MCDHELLWNDGRTDGITYGRTAQRQLETIAHLHNCIINNSTQLIYKRLSQFPDIVKQKKDQKPTVFKITYIAARVLSESDKKERYVELNVNYNVLTAKICSLSLCI